ncbi:MAG: helix-turn-helix transcriptional regulator [Bauldia sp.]|nr:helix-turn-helix transcriptional regulator [Bauldia sp.]
MDQTADIERVAGSLGLGVRALQRRLNGDGVNFRELVNRVRIARATEFLRGSAESITTIAAELGYVNSTHFTRAFKAAVGLSPRDFRRRRFTHQALAGRE